MAALVLATGVAIVVTQKLRREGTVIALVSDRDERGCPSLRPVGPRLPVPVSFLLTRDDTIDLSIVRYDDERRVRTLGLDLDLEGGRRYCFVWAGRRDAGGFAPPGRYRLQVALKRADRVATGGEAIDLRPLNDGASPGG